MKRKFANGASNPIPTDHQERHDRYADFLNGYPPPDFEVALAFDDEHGQYILRRIGCSPKQRYHYTDIHLILRNGKIWIEEGMTEEGIANMLQAHGVPHEDIILGFQPPSLRRRTAIALA